ncbi:hypothetical protein A8L34_14975 [Bacillus sp. FJAT-27264]|uniref:hypothetical protein n=1 Tax=Paenibacillus sp. (strain DSM 101736 / FJAT-27264) TaxID=1850362 RepID=UPI000808175A|nr:hypothetical protein [Bacillus sp. FJAT-27264]OBZ11647.1 hypothetical protein A8L34_14975 [Bacillus sp. FJAT-27264]
MSKKDCKMEPARPFFLNAAPFDGSLPIIDYLAVTMIDWVNLIGEPLYKLHGGKRNDYMNRGWEYFA